MDNGSWLHLTLSGRSNIASIVKIVKRSTSCVSDLRTVQGLEASGVHMTAEEPILYFIHLNE